MLRTKAVWLFGAALVLAGLSLLLYLVALLFWESGASRNEDLGAVLRLVDHSLRSLHIAMVVAPLGVALGSLGVLIARRQRERIRVEKLRAEDRLRRAHLYRDGGRLEPFIGPGGREVTEDQ